jgi:hypothetical protein
MKIRPVGAEYMYAGGRTDMTKLPDLFGTSTNASKKEMLLQIFVIHINQLPLFGKTALSYT